MEKASKKNKVFLKCIKNKISDTIKVYQINLRRIKKWTKTLITATHKTKIRTQTIQAAQIRMPTT